MPALCGNSLVTVFLLHIITKFASMNHWQKMSKEIPSHCQVGRYGRLIHPWPWQHLLAKSPRTFNAATQTNRAKPLPESHFPSNSSFFFAFVTITACISSAHMLFSMLFARGLGLWPTSCSHWLVSVLCSTYYDYGHFIVRKPSAKRLSEVTTIKLPSGSRPKSAGFQALLWAVHRSVCPTPSLTLSNPALKDSLLH